MNVVLPTRMTVDEFLAWSARQEEGRYELFEGRVIMQQPQSWGHAELCVRIYNALAAAIGHSGVPFYAAPVGMTVRIVEKTAFEPDALVAPLPKPQRLDLEISNPVLVVEVVSRSTAKRDRTDKLAGYFKVPSIQHYLIFDPEKREVIWHHRTAAGTLQPPATLREGLLALDPPGIELSVADIFPPE
jgi:Uma2 family endonuclease